MTKLSWLLLSGARVWEAPSGSGSGRFAINARSTDPEGTMATWTRLGSVE